MNEMWKSLQSAGKVGNSFIIASKKLNIPVQNIIVFVYDEDLKNNIDFMPALKRNLFFQETLPVLTKAMISFIIEDNDQKVSYRIQRFKELEELCESKDPQNYLKLIFEK